MAILDVPTIRRGIFNGFKLDDLDRVVEDTMKAMPYLRDAQLTGSYRGEKNARFNNEPVPPFLHLRHFPNDIALEKVKEWAKDVIMEPDVRQMNGEAWGFTHFSNVDPELAKLLSVGFPYRSAEFLRDFENPDTGEVYPVVLRSVAFLDANTEPAVPQYPGYSVKLASTGGLGVLTVPCEEPEINTMQKENNAMPENEQGTGKLSEQAIQRVAAMEKRLAELDGLAEENKILRSEVGAIKLSYDKVVAESEALRQQAHNAEVEAYCAKLAAEHKLTPAALEAITPVLAAQGGIVKMSADSEEIPIDKAYRSSIEALIKLAAEKDALFVPQNGTLPIGKQNVEKPKTLQERKQEAIAKFSKTAEGLDVPYPEAILKASRDKETAHLFNPLATHGGN